MEAKCSTSDDEDDTELLWVKAGEPGEKPTIIRQIRSESSSSGSRDNSGGSGCNRKALLTVENGTVYRTGTSNESLNRLKTLARTSSNDSRVIVVNVSEQIYPINIDKQRLQRWRDLHSPRGTRKELSSSVKKCQNNNIEINDKSTSNRLTKRPLSQPLRPLSNVSPKIERCASAEHSSSPFNRVKALRTRDEGYTSLSEDCKDSDTESVRSRSLPSSWRPSYLNKREEPDIQKYAQRLTSNQNVDVNFTSCDQKCSKNRLLNKKTKKNKRNHKIRHHVENAIELCTCFVCLRSAVYLAEDEDDTDSLVDHPCSCETPNGKCCARWAVISLLVCFLPFLLCYPPLKSCLCIHDARIRRKKKKKGKKMEKKRIKMQHQRKL